MEGYELTKRGKIYVAVVLVLLVLVLPAAIFLFNAVAAQSYEGQVLQVLETPHSYTPPPVISESPPPDGGGFNPSVVSPPEEDSEFGVFVSPTEQDTSSLPVFGPAGGNPSEGSLSFSFSPNLQSELDAQTMLMLYGFLRSPKNTQGSLISIETPYLDTEDSEKLMSAIVNAFAAHEIPEQRIVYVANPAVSSAETFEVNLSFITSPGSPK